MSTDFWHRRVFP